ncbi:helicase [Brachybacterium endophyticum]|uniref:Helicase n=1 Tax=Brachybacterium endophyticum TaxID=2182385 RepID=A0A2U2RNK7_9MICO|nr:helicase-related protein [Brachybacterium endophyticum]PWH07421.1 helicase [Brachybacterium endophyticum]
MTNDQTARPDVDALLSRLKPFQRATVDHAFRRLWTDDDAVDRFLVADEVGLGKTLVAKGVAARAIDHLWDRGRAITLVYICSNAQIAGQNLDRLRDLTGGHTQQNADRITLLPRTMGARAERGVELVSFTPGTSFRLGHSAGRVGERSLLYWMLTHVLEPRWMRRAGVIDFFRNTVTHERFTSRLEWDRPELDSQLMADFEATLRAPRGASRPSLLEELCAEIETWLRYRTRTPEMDYRRKDLLGELRMAMAQVSVARLNPDLVILDEFQRFKDLFPGSRSDGDPELTDAQRLAQNVITTTGTKSLVLSATPYKMFTLPDEPDGEDHLRDFHDTIGFLAGRDRAQRVARHLADVRTSMLLRTPEGEQAARRANDAATRELKRVMCRTERLEVTQKRDGMVTEMDMPALTLGPLDLETWIANDRIARNVHGHDVFEYWRSSPYPVNLMDPSSYLAQKRVLEKAESQDADLAALLRAHRGGLLAWNDVLEYRKIDPGNPKLRAVMDDAMERGIWKLAWLPPSLPYIEPAGVYASEGARSFTKRLIFSAWSVVPKAIATLFSYEADRRLSKYAPRATDGSVAQYGVRRSTPLIRFGVADGKLLNLPHLALVHPSVALARLGDPLAIARESGETLPLERGRLLELVTSRIQTELDALDLPAGDKKGQSAAWYGIAPYLLDRRIGIEELAVDGGLSSADEGEDTGSRLGDHIAFALEPGLESLGAPPEDLAKVLAGIALGAPGVCALRALGRACGGPATYVSSEIRRAAFSIGEAFRALFNRPETMSAVRAATETNSEDTDGHWQRVVRYCLDGNLQAMLDEYVHTLVDSLGLVDDQPVQRAEKLAERICSTATIRNPTNEVHELREQDSRIDIDVHRMTSHIAARFGRIQNSESAEQRETSIRDSYNSPFWPFVMASTSVGQEGLDFHTYSHAIVHWNLPDNPVDLEQREGRVHRYKGHAIRKNIAADYAQAAMNEQDEDPWRSMFAAAESDVAGKSSGMSPYWIYEGTASIERYVPAMPLSRESAQYARLQRTLGAYRSVMGQPRQDDLIRFIGDAVEWPRVDLRPPPSEAVSTAVGEGSQRKGDS